MQIKKANDHYLVESSRKGAFYDVWPERPFCSCPDFRFQKIRNQGTCKHLKAVEALLTTNSDTANKASNQEAVLAEVKKRGEIETTELLDRFGEVVDELIKRGELIESRGKVRILS